MGLDAVVFDYGHTLVDYTLPEQWVREAYDDIRAVLATAAEREVPSADDLIERVAQGIGRRVQESYEQQRLDELDILVLFEEALSGIGFHPSPDLVLWVVETEHAAGSRHVAILPDTLSTLRRLRELGLRIGIVSNAHYLPYMMRRDWDRLGIGPFVDTAVISSEVGIRKPHPDIFLGLLRRLQVQPARALFVGDRLRDDIAGAQRVGMSAVLTREFRQEEVGPTTAQPDLVVERLPDVLPYVEKRLQA